jgi:hypothetical protein
MNDAAISRKKASLARRDDIAQGCDAVLERHVSNSRQGRRRLADGRIQSARLKVKLYR